MRAVFPVLLVSGLLFVGCAASRVAPPAGSLKGVWKLVEAAGDGAESGPALFIFTERHYSTNLQREPRPAFSMPPSEAPAAELRAVWGPFVAHAGTYDAVDGTITVQPLVAKNPVAMGPEAFITYAFEWKGDTLMVSPIANQHGVAENAWRRKYIRVE